jgi:flagellar biosynthesis chaperone FliJ
MWARLDERMRHLVSAVDDIKSNMATKGEIAHLVNKAAHDASIGNLQGQIDTLKEAVKQQSASVWMDRIRSVALTIAAMAAAGGVIVAIVRAWDRLP